MVLDIAGDVQVEAAALRQNIEGDLVLSAADADVHGHSARFEDAGDKRCIGFWTDVNDSVSWNAAINQTGFFEIEVTYACPKESAGSEYVLTVGEHTFNVSVTTPTASWSEFRTVSFPAVRITKAGPLAVSITPKTKPGYAVMNLREVKLKMVKGKQ